MKKQIQVIMVLFFVLASLVSIFPIFFVYAAQFQSEFRLTCIDRNLDRVDDLTHELCPEITTCGLQLLAGVPIKYGTLNLGQDSVDQIVTYKNTGTASAKVMVKGGPWIGGPTGTTTMSGPEITHVSKDPNIPWGSKMMLQGNEIQLSVVGGLQTGQSFWQLRVPNSGFNGTLHQDVTMDLVC